MNTQDRISELESKESLTLRERDELRALKYQPTASPVPQPENPSHRRAGILQKLDSLSDQQLKGLEILLINHGYVESDETIARRVADEGRENS